MGDWYLRQPPYEEEAAPFEPMPRTKMGKAGSLNDSRRKRELKGTFMPKHRKRRARG